MSAVTLSVGAGAVALRCPDAGLAERLGRRYAAFPADGPPRLSLTLDLVAPGRLPAPPALSGVRAALAGPGSAAELDLAAGAGWLRAAPAQALAAVEELLRVAAAVLAFEAGGLLLHAAGLARAGRAFLFLGPSGAGKTTVARLAAGRRVLNDDLVAVLPAAGGWDVCATPFSNPTQVPPAGPGRAALAALLHLVQDTRVERRPLGPAAATAALVARAPLVALDPERGPALLRRARAIAAAAPCDELHFLPDQSFWAAVDPIEIADTPRDRTDH